MTLDLIKDEMMIKRLMDEMKMKNELQEESFWERGEGMTVTKWTFEESLNWKCCMIKKSRLRDFSAKNCKKKLRREVEIAALWKRNLLRPERKNLHLKLKTKNLQVLRFRKKLKHLTLHNYTTNTNNSAVSQFRLLIPCGRHLGSGFLLLLPPALSPAKALLLAPQSLLAEVWSAYPGTQWLPWGRASACPSPLAAQRSSSFWPWCTGCPGWHATCPSSSTVGRSHLTASSEGLQRDFIRYQPWACPASWPDKKENKIFLIYKEIQNGAVAKVIYD